MCLNNMDRHMTSCLNNAHNINVQTTQIDDCITVYFIRTYEKKISHDYYCQIVAHEVCDVGAKPIGSRKVENGVDGPCIGAPLVKLCHLFKMYLVACPYVAFKHSSI
jgi:hypothetical protein